MFTGNTETRIAATYEDGDGTIDLVVDDMTANTQNTTTLSFVDSSNDVILRNTTGGATSGTQDIKFVAGSNVTLTPSGSNMTIASQAFGTVHTVASESAMISATSTSGDIVIRTDVSKTFIHNGGTAGTAADFSELQFSGINNLALTAGDGIDLSRTTVTNTNNDLTITNSLATTTERGGVKIGYTTDASNRNYAVQLDSEKAYVNVPWTDTDTNTFRTVQADGSAIGATETLNLIGGTNVTLSESSGAITIAATDTNTFRTVTAGGNTLGASETLAFTAGSNVTISENAGAVTIASTDTNTQRSDEDIRDVIVSMLTAGSNITLNEDDAANTLTITSTDTDTNTFRTVTVDTDGDGSANNTLGATENLMLKKGGGITLAESSGVVTISHTDTSSQDTVNNSGRTYIQDITLDTYGHVTGLTSATETVTDTNTFRTIKVDTNNDGTANETIGATEELKLIGGTNVTLAESAGTVTITSTDTNTTYDVMGSGNSYAAGLVLAGNATHGGAFLRKDGTWQVPPDNNDNTTYSAGTGLSLSGTTFNANVDGTQTTAANTSTTTANRTYKVQVDGNDNLVVNVPWVDTDTNTDTIDMGDGFTVSADTNTATTTITENDTLTIAGGTNVTTVSNPDGTITINATDTNTQLSTEQVQDIVGSMVAANTEANITVSYDDSEGKLNFTVPTIPSGISGTGLISYNSSTGVISTTANNYSLPTATSSTLGGVKVGTGLTISSGVLEVDLTTGGRMTGDLEIDNSDPNLILNDSTANSTSTTYTPAILFRADDVNKAVIGKKGGSENIFHVENYDGPLTVSGMQDSKTISAEFAHEPANTSGHYGLKLTDSSTQSHSLYIAPSAFNNQSSLFFNGTTNALNVSRISHNNSLGTLLIDVPDDGTSTTSVKFRQYNTGGYMQNMIDFEDDGDINNINGTYGTISSDRRVKENIVDATPKLNDILSLNVKNFNFIGDNKKQIGLIAQDVESVFPSWVKTSDTRIYKTHDENGVLLEEQGELISGHEDGKSLKVGMEFAVLVKTIQELNAKIEGLEQRIQTLENN
jgi:hypothetical protein